MKLSALFLLFFPCWMDVATENTADSPGASPEVLYEGVHLTLLTSGNYVVIGRNKKAGIWRVPARMASDLWVKRTDETDPVRLEPGTFRSQLLQMLDDFPELHGAIRDKSYSYRELEGLIVDLDRHISKIQRIRLDRKRIAREENLLLE